MKLAGALGGQWTLVLNVPNCCHECGRMVESAWCYFIGPKCTVVLCEECTRAHLEAT